MSFSFTYLYSSNLTGAGLTNTHGHNALNCELAFDAVHIARLSFLCGIVETQTFAIYK